MKDGYTLAGIRVTIIVPRVHMYGIALNMPYRIQVSFLTLNLHIKINPLHYVNNATYVTNYVN